MLLEDLRIHCFLSNISFQKFLVIEQNATEVFNMKFWVLYLYGFPFVSLRIAISSEIFQLSIYIQAVLLKTFL